MKRLLILAYLLLISFGCSPLANCGDAQGKNSCTRILFIGNSYTYVNDLPGTFAQLANAGAHRVAVEMVAEGGWTLADHVNSSRTLDKIKSAKWHAELREHANPDRLRITEHCSGAPCIRCAYWRSLVECQETEFSAKPMAR